MTTTTTKRRRGNPSGASHEVPRSREALASAGIGHAHLSDAEAVRLSECVLRADVCLDAVRASVAEHWHPRRALLAEERAERAFAALPRSMRAKYRAALRGALATLHPAPVQPEPTTVRDILAAESQLLARRRAGRGDMKSGEP